MNFEIHLFLRYQWNGIHPRRFDNTEAVVTVGTFSLRLGRNVKRLTSLRMCTHAFSFLSVLLPWPYMAIKSTCCSAFYGNSRVVFQQWKFSRKIWQKEREREERTLGMLRELFCIFQDFIWVSNVHFKHWHTFIYNEQTDSYKMASALLQSCNIFDENIVRYG